MMLDAAASENYESRMRVPLTTGDLHLRMDRGGRSDLFQIAERINPKRSFLFVSTVLGRHIPVRPSKHMQDVDRLAHAVRKKIGARPALVMGYAETAVGLGAAVARSLSRSNDHDGVSYLSTTRHAVPGREWLTFSEGHSHATEHHVLKPDPGILPPVGAALVLVDDETTTGATFTGLASALYHAGQEFSQIILVTLTDWSAGRSAQSVSSACDGLAVDSISLTTGQWKWQKNPDVMLPELPPRCPAATPAWTPSESAPRCYASPRLGLKDFEGPNLDVLRDRGLTIPQKGARTLVLGSGENVWAPMVLAERLEQSGFDVSFAATTRSPILPGGTIREKWTFPDHFGEGVNMHLHNVITTEWDHIILMTETGQDGVCRELREQLGYGQVICGRGYIKEIKLS